MNPSNGSVSSSALTTNVWYDHRGNAIEESSPGGLVTKAVYDGAGRVSEGFVTDGAGGTSWSAASSVASDTVLEQAEFTYDANSNVIETVARCFGHRAGEHGRLQFDGLARDSH